MAMTPDQPRFQLCKVCGANDCDRTIKDLRNFQAGASSRDAEIQRLQMALADTEALEIGTAEKCGQLREQVQLLREALEYSVKQVPELGTVPGIANALADTESKQ